MIEKVFKVGDTITIKRTSQAGTGYRYAFSTPDRRSCP